MKDKTTKNFKKAVMFLEHKIWCKEKIFKRHTRHKYENKH